MTTDYIDLGFAALAGAALGLFYFGGLWLTVRQLPSSNQPGLLMLSSFVIRLAVTLAGFFVVMAGHWQSMLACLAGFVLMRIVLVQRWRPAPVDAPEPNHEEKPPCE